MAVVQYMFKPCRYRKCIRSHIPMHTIFAAFIYLSYLFYSGCTLCLRTPKTKKIEQLFYYLFVQARDIHELCGGCFCACSSHAHKKYPRKMWDIQVCYILISMIQQLLNCSCVALQYVTGTKLLIE